MDTKPAKYMKNTQKKNIRPILQNCITKQTYCWVVKSFSKLDKSNWTSLILSDRNPDGWTTSDNCGTAGLYCLISCKSTEFWYIFSVNPFAAIVYKIWIKISILDLIDNSCTKIKEGIDEKKIIKNSNCTLSTYGNIYKLCPHTRHEKKQQLKNK